MKRLLLLLMVMGSCLAVVAQNTTRSSVKPEDITVRDSAGTEYPTAIWQKLITSGKYGLSLSPDKKNGLLKKLSDEEMEARFSKMPKPQESKFFKDGEKISPFNERDMSGTKFSLKELLGKVVVLNFWFINCPPCRMEIPDLNEMRASYKGNSDVVFIAVALDQKSELKEFLKSTPYTYNIIDNGGFIASKYGVNLFPTHVVLDRQGKVVFHTSGLAMNTVSWVKKSIETALQGTAAQ